MTRLALDNARENADLNAVAKRIAFSTTPVAQVRGKFDLVVANILCKTLIAMAPDLKRLVARERTSGARRDSRARGQIGRIALRPELPLAKDHDRADGRRGFRRGEGQTR